MATRDPDLHEQFIERVLELKIAICAPVKIELLHSAQNRKQFRKLRGELDALEDVPVTSSMWTRAIDVYESLAKRGGAHHRQVSKMDLLIAAAAEGAGMSLLHYDADYDVIAKVTGQRACWIAPRGTL